MSKRGLNQFLAKIMAVELRAQDTQKAVLQKRIRLLKERLRVAEDLALEAEHVYVCQGCPFLARCPEDVDDDGLVCSVCSDAYCHRCTLEYMRTCPEHGNVYCAERCRCEDC